MIIRANRVFTINTMVTRVIIRGFRVFTISTIFIRVTISVIIFLGSLYIGY